MQRVSVIGWGAWVGVIMAAVLLASFWIAQPSAPAAPAAVVVANPAIVVGREVVSLRGRSYLLYKPANRRVRRPLPLVIELHGNGGSPAGVDAKTRFSALGVPAGFIVVAPAGYRRSWSDGRTGETVAARAGVDDVAFIEHVIDDVARHVPIDRRRIYLSGISSGALMATRFACEHPELVAGLALVGGTAATPVFRSCRTTRPLSVIEFHGTRDPVVPYGGGPVISVLGHERRGTAVGVDAFASLFARVDGCDADPDASRVADAVDLRRWTGCTAGTGLAFYRLDGAGHTWPGGAGDMSSSLVGRTNLEIDATQLALDFFAVHRDADAVRG